MGDPVFFGQTWVPASDNATTPIGSSTPHTITPPASMREGMFVVVFVTARNNTDPAVSNDGGQTWTSQTSNVNGSTIVGRLFTCVFNGTWSANPTFSTGSDANGVCLYMGVWSSCAGFDVSPTALDLASGTSKTLPTFDTGVNGALAVFIWGEPDDNVLSGQDAGWTGPNGSTGSLNDHVGNQGGSDIGLFVSVKSVTTAGASGSNVVALNTADVGAGYYFSLKPNTSPTVSVNTPSNGGTVSSTLPTFEFTGTDADGDPVRYRLQVASDSSFTTGAIDKGTPAGSQNSGGDITTSITIASQTVIVAIATSQDSNTNNIQLAGIARNSENFTKIEGYGGSGGSGQPVYAEAWYLANPSVGTYDAVADFNGSVNNNSITYYLLTGADASDVVNAYSGNSAGSGSNTAVSVTTDAGNCLIIAGMACEGTISGVDSPAVEDASYTDQSYENTSVASLDGGSSAATETINFNNASNPQAYVIVAINKAAGGGSILIDVISGTDTGFANTVTPADTDPFNSGEKADYDMQSGDELTDTNTYYLRVAAEDPTGSEEYGAWSSTISFTVSVAATAIKKVSSVAYASIKKISGVAIASIKKISGLA